MARDLQLGEGLHAKHCRLPGRPRWRDQRFVWSQAVDDYTITIQLDKAQAAFLNLLTYSMNGIIPKQECLEAGDAWGNDVVIGTGPFKFVAWERGAKAIYERYPDYHFGAPFLVED